MNRGNAGPRDIGKRRLLNFLFGSTLLAGLGGTLYTLLKYLSPPEELLKAAEEKVVRVAKVSDVPPGRSKKFRFGRYPGIQINYNGKFLAYGAICTHLACVVHWKDEHGCEMAMGDQIHCVCHAGHFAAQTGNVLSGPPPSPLPKIDIVDKDGEIFTKGWGDPGYVKSIKTYT